MTPHIGVYDAICCLMHTCCQMAHVIVARMLPSGNCHTKITANYTHMRSPGCQMAHVIIARVFLSGNCNTKITENYTHEVQDVGAHMHNHGCMYHLNLMELLLGEYDLHEA